MHVMAEDCGLAAVALHARTREQGYSGNARWEWIAAVKDAVRIPVIGNGDIRTPEDASAMIAQTGCDAVMIGRTAPANPWIFRQISQYATWLEEGANDPVSGKLPYDEPAEADRYQMIRTYFRMFRVCPGKTCTEMPGTISWSPSSSCICPLSISGS